MLCFVLNKSRKIIRIFTKWPHWAKDLYSLVSYINFIELIPTIAVITLYPRHFFRRLPMVIQHKRILYSTPIKFFANAAALFTIVFLIRHPDIGQNIEPVEAVWYMLVLIPLTPFIMAGLCLAVWSIYQLPRIIPTSKPFPQPNPYPLWLVISLTTYRNLDGRRFFWGLFYFSIYLVASWQIAAIFIGHGWLALNELLHIFATERGIVELIIVIITMVVFAAIVHWLVFRPYAEMIRMSLKRPLNLVFNADVYDVSCVISDFIVDAEQKKPSDQDFNMFLLALEMPLASTEMAVRLQDCDYNSLKTANGYGDQRAEVFRNAFKVSKLETILKNTKEVSEEVQKRVETVLSTMHRLEI